MSKIVGKKMKLSSFIFFLFFIFIYADAVLQNGEENGRKWMKVPSSVYPLI